MTTLLIVDDRPISREVLSSLLDEYGYSVLEAEDGLQALELVKSKNINLIITDIAMPKMDGLALIKELQEDPIHRKIPIIIYTGMYKPQEAYRIANAANVRFVLTKPCDPEIILGTLAGVIDSNTQLLNTTIFNHLDNTEKKEKLQNINMRLTNLIEIGLDISFENNIEKLIHILCKSSRQFLNASYGGILLKDSNDLSQLIHYSVDENNRINIDRIRSEHFSESLKQLFISEKLILIHSPIIDVEKLRLTDISLPLSSLLAIPLKTQTMYGKIYFINKKDRKIFTLGDQRFMMTLADKFSVKYENLILYQTIEQMTKIVRSSSLDEMASSLAHEINQPLTAIAAYIKGCIKRLNHKNEVTPEILQVLNEISVQAERAGEVVHRIKNFVRKGKLFYETLDINSIIEQSILLIKQESQNNTIDIIYEPNINLPLVEIDKIQIQQVLLNLLRNAFEAMTQAKIENPKIVIHISQKVRDRILVSIMDNGPGFSEQIASQLFEPYFTTKSDGMGLGLSICRSVIEAHSGQLMASVLPQGGSCFQFDLKSTPSDCS